MRGGCCFDYVIPSTQTGLGATRHITSVMRGISLGKMYKDCAFGTTNPFP